MPSLTNPWVLTMLAIMSVVLIAMILRATHRLRHGKTPTALAPLPAAQPQPHAAQLHSSIPQHNTADDDEDPLLAAKGA